MPDLPSLRRYAVERTLFPKTTLPRALDRLGFVQADPIRAPARAQDLVLRHRVTGYRAGQLEARYPRLAADETFFINYGFVPRRVYALMHPRDPEVRKDTRRAKAVLDFVTRRKVAHPREVDAHFDHGTETNWWGGQSSATTRVLDHLHYRGLLRVVRRENGVRVYGPVPAAAEHELTLPERVDALIDVVVGLYAPLPAVSLGYAVSRLRYAIPPHTHEVRAGLRRARERLAHHRVGGVEWYWPARERPDAELRDEVRLLAPFDPIVWDRRRFELLWGWGYRFEAYTPRPKRKHGYYALPLAWRDQVIGWANVTAEPFSVELGWAARARPPKRLLDDELERLRSFL